MRRRIKVVRKALYLDNILFRLSKRDELVPSAPLPGGIMDAEPQLNTSPTRATEYKLSKGVYKVWAAPLDG